MGLLDFFTPHGEEDAINLLKKDHENVKALFDKFEKAETVREKVKIAADTIMELKLHAAIEEEIFYAVVRPQIEKKIMNEADEEHHVVKLLISELEEMDGSEDHYDAKYKVLSENVKHHIKEEESDMLAKARALDVDYDAIGASILARKAQLKKTGVPSFAEEKMVSKSRGKGDSPARAAKKTRPAKAFKKPAPKKAKVLKMKKPVKAAKSLVKKTKKAVKSTAAKVVKLRKPARKNTRVATTAKKKAGRK